MPRKLQPAKLPAPPKNLPRLSKDQKKIFIDLQNEVSHLFLRWKIFRQLFATNGDRIKLMNALAPTVFSEIQRTLIDEIFLQISRITDRKGKYDKKKKVLVQETVVLEQLRAGLGNHYQPALAADLDNRLKNDVGPKCEEIRKHRHKRIAHADKLMLVRPSLYILPQITKKMIDEALNAIADYVNAFRTVFFGSPMYFAGVHTIDDGDSFIHVLKEAFAFSEMARKDWTLRQRLEQGPFGKA